MQAWLVALVLLMASVCSTDSIAGNPPTGRVPIISRMLARLQTIGELGAKINAAITREMGRSVLERRYKNMYIKRSKMSDNQFEYNNKLYEQYDEANQKGDELLAQVREKFADYERTHGDDKRDEDKNLLAELARQHDEYKEKMQSLCDCYQDKLDDLKGEYDISLLTLANTYEKEILAGAHAKMEEVLDMNTKSKNYQEHYQAVRDNYLRTTRRIDDKLQEALHEYREDINEEFFIQVEKLYDSFEHWEQHLYEEFLRYQYRWGGRQAREEYQRKQEQRRHEHQQQREQRWREQQQREQQRQQQRQAHHRQAQNLTAAELESYTAILGLNANATLSEIKKTYRKLAKKYHPDKSQTSQDADAAKFIEVTDAYFILRDYFTKSK